MQNPKYGGQELEGDLEAFFHEVCQQRNKPGWKVLYCCIADGYFLTSLRALLVSLGIHNWMELTSGFSWRQYRALDMYVRVFSGGMPPPAEEAWYLLNAEVPVVERGMPAPEGWYLFKTWTSMGQRACMTEWELSTEGMRQRFPQLPVWLFEA